MVLCASELIRFTRFNLCFIRKDLSDLSILILSFVKLINTLFSYKQENVFKIIEKTIDITGLVRRLEDDPTPENINRIENIGELVNTMKLFSLRPKNNQLIHFINEISLDETKEDNEETEYVSLMTIHQSKGLEFPHVYIVGLENGLFPSQKNMREKSITKIALDEHFWPVLGSQELRAREIHTFPIAKMRSYRAVPVALAV